VILPCPPRSYDNWNWSDHTRSSAKPAFRYTLQLRTVTLSSHFAGVLTRARSPGTLLALTESINGVATAHVTPRLRTGVFLFCGVDMPDAGHGGTPPQDRRYGQADVLRVYDDLVAFARAADDLDFESMWLAEHHFQYEGYEVVPNAILMAA